MYCMLFISLLLFLTRVFYVKDRRPVGLPATGNERHGVQGSTPVSEGCDRYHPLLLPWLSLGPVLHYLTPTGRLHQSKSTANLQSDDRWVNSKYLIELSLRLTSMKERWRLLYKAYIKWQQTPKEALKCRSVRSLFLSLHYRITALISLWYALH